MLFPRTALVSITLPLFVSAAKGIVDDAVPVSSAKVPSLKGAFIVELENNADLDNSLGKRGLAAQTTGHDAFFGLLKDLGIGYSKRQTYNTPELFHGVSISINSDGTSSDPITLQHLLDLPGVLNAWPVHTYFPLDVNSPRRLSNPVDWQEVARRHEIAMEERELAAELESQLDARDLTGIVAGITGDASASTSAKKSYPSIPVSKFRKDTFAPHIMTHVDKVHARGILGKGIKVAVIDTGVDYKHPALGGGFGPGHKISFGADIVGDNYSGLNTPHGDKDPYDPCGEHGTHVTGIVGADPNPFNFTGVAPYAELGHYRVFGCVPPTVTQDDVMIKAMEMAYHAGADVITLSIGGENGWTEDAASEYANRLNKKGRIVTIAAGNAGSEGLFYASSPAASTTTWSVGSVEVTELPILRTAVATTGKKIPYYSLFKFNDTASKLPLHATSKNISDLNDACTPFPKGTDLSKYLVITQRGNCFIDTKYANLAAAGARYVLLANDNATAFYNDGKTDGLIQAALVPDAEGKWLRERAIAGTKTYVDFSSDASMPVEDAVGGLIDAFSTWGPTFDFVGQPTLSAPGGNILSTFPLRLGGYGIISGTSMATPHTAGAAALYLSGCDLPHDSIDVRGVFTTTGNQLPVSKTDSRPIPIVHQGGGMIDVDRAILTQTLVSPYQLALNDSKHFKSTFTIKITNRERKAQTYYLSHEPALTANTYDAGNYPFVSLAPELTETYATAHFNHKTVTVHGHGQATFEVKFTPPKTNQKRGPVYGGYVVLHSKTETLRIPYHGYAASLYDTPILDNTNTIEGAVVPLIVDSKNVSTGDIQSGSRTYTLKGNDFPTLIYRLLFGSASVQVDLVDANTNFKPTTADPYSNITATSAPHNGQKYKDVKIVGNIPELSGTYLPRSAEVAGDDTDFELTWSGNVTVNNKSKKAANGNYRFLLRALKLTGNPTLESEYESWLSPIIRVKRA